MDELFELMRVLSGIQSSLRSIERQLTSLESKSLPMTMPINGALGGSAQSIGELGYRSVGDLRRYAPD